MQRMYVAIMRNLEQMRKAAGGTKIMATESVEAKREREEEEEATLDETKQNNISDGVEVLERTSQQDEKEALNALNNDDTPMCILPVGAQEDTHAKPSGTPTSHTYISYRPKSGRDQNCAPTNGHMTGLMGALIIVADSTLSDKVGMSLND